MSARQIVTRSVSRRLHAMEESGQPSLNPTPIPSISNEKQAANSSRSKGKKAKKTTATDAVIVLEEREKLLNGQPSLVNPNPTPLPSTSNQEQAASSKGKKTKATDAVIVLDEQQPSTSAATNKPKPNPSKPKKKNKSQKVLKVRPPEISKKAMRKLNTMGLRKKKARSFFASLGVAELITVAHVSSLTESQLEKLRNRAQPKATLSAAYMKFILSKKPETTMPAQAPTAFSKKTSSEFQPRYPASYYRSCLEQDDFDQLNKMVASLDWSGFSRLQAKHQKIKDNDANDVVTVGRPRKNSIHLDDDESEAKMLAMKKEIKEEADDDIIILET